ncbi:hypothetical protein RUND412_004544 [Rhizina undulata]
MVLSFVNHANLLASITLVVPGEVIPLILGLVALGTGYLVRLCWLLIRWAPWGIWFWYIYHTQTKETSWFRVVIIPFIRRRISQRVRRCHEPEHGREMLEVPAAIVSQLGHLPGLFPLPVSQELKTPGHGTVRVIPAGKAPSHGCVRVNSLKADKVPPKPTSPLTASDDDINLIAVSWKLWETREARKRAEMEQKEADARAKAQLAAEADEEWRIWTITNTDGYARARAGAAMAISRNQMASSIQHQQELMLAETGPPLRIDQQWSPQVVPVIDQEVEMVDVAPGELEVRMASGPMEAGIMPVGVMTVGVMSVGPVGVMPVEVAGVQKKAEKEMNRRYRQRFD